LLDDRISGYLAVLVCTMAEEDTERPSR